MMLLVSFLWLFICVASFWIGLTIGAYPPYRFSERLYGETVEGTGEEDGDGTGRDEN